MIHIPFLTKVSSKTIKPSSFTVPNPKKSKFKPLRFTLFKCVCSLKKTKYDDSSMLMFLYFSLTAVIENLNQDKYTIQSLITIIPLAFLLVIITSPFQGAWMSVNLILGLDEPSKRADSKLLITVPVDNRNKVFKYPICIERNFDWYQSKCFEVQLN